MGVAKDMIRTKQVEFDIGSNSATMHGKVKGYETVYYKLNAKSGQTMRVKLDSSVAYFNIFSPHKGPGDAAMFIGSTEGEKYEGMLSKNGTYTIQVYMMRNEARRGTKALYVLEVSID